MGIVSSKDSGNNQLQINQFGDVVFPPGSKIQADNGNKKKEGPCLVLSSRKIVIGKLNYHDDKLEGLNIFFDSNGVIVKEGLFVNGVQNGWGCEYKDNKVAFEGIYRNGERHSELRMSSTNDGYMEEVKDEKILSICKFNSNHTIEGLGLLFEYDGDKVKEVFDCENGEKRVKRLEFKEDTMIELNDEGDIVYMGNYTGNPQDGFLRNGEGVEYDGIYSYRGEWKDGKREGNGKFYIEHILKYNGEWKEGKPYGNGKLYNEARVVLMKNVWKNEDNDVENSIFRINDSCYVELMDYDVYINEKTNNGITEYDSWWKRYPLRKMTVDERKEWELKYDNHETKPTESSIEKNEEIILEETKEDNEMKSTESSLEMKMIIASNNQLGELLRNDKMRRNLTNIVVGEECEREIELYGFENLRRIVMKNNLSILIIHNNPVLKSIVIEDSVYEKPNYYGHAPRMTVLSGIRLID